MTLATPLCKTMVNKVYVGIGGKKISSLILEKRRCIGLSDVQGLRLPPGGPSKGPCLPWGLALGPAASENWMALRTAPYEGTSGAHMTQPLRLKNKTRMSKTWAWGSHRTEGTEGRTTQENKRQLFLMLVCPVLRSTFSYRLKEFGITPLLPEKTWEKN